MRGRTGLMLIEVLAALAILGIGAAAWAGMLSEGMHTVRLAQARDAQIRDASEQLGRVSVWTHADFASRVGRSNWRGYLLSVTELRPSLYDVVVADTLQEDTILHTSFYKRDSSATGSR